MEPLTAVLSGIVIALIGGIAGKRLGEVGKVTETSCLDHRVACNNLISEKLSNIEGKVDSLTKSVNNKLFGL